MSIAGPILILGGFLPGQIEIPVETADSTLTIELCVQGVCDTDVSPLTGTVTIDLDAPAAPTQIALIDCTLDATESYDFSLTFGIFSRLLVTATEVGFDHAAPGPQPFYPISNGQFAIPDVPIQSRGLADYDATGTVCLALLAAGLPCAGTIDFAAGEPTLVDSIPGTIAVNDGVIHVTADVAFSTPIDPANPDLGAINGMATIVGSAPVPIPGDFDFDGDVDLSDYAVFLGCYNGPGRPPAGQECGPSDFDDDGDVDLSDYGTFLDCYNGPNNPPACL
jgi:hypothetical protein